MNLVTTLAMILVSTSASGNVPSAIPSNASLYYYSGSFVGVQWTNGDSTASTQIGYSEEENTEPSSVADTVGSGVTSYETTASGTIVEEDGSSGPLRIWVRHIKSGSTTIWVRADKMAEEYVGVSV